MYQCEKGNIILMFLLSMMAGIIICGMIIETSFILYTKSRMFNDAENTVLAAACKYYKDQLSSSEMDTYIRTEFCPKNYLIPDVTSIDYSRINQNIIALTSRRDLGVLLFSRTPQIACRVAATLPGKAGSATGLVPFAVLDEDLGQNFEYGVPYTLKFGANEDDPEMSTLPGNYGALALEGTGADVYLDNIKYGYNGTINAGDFLMTEPGNITGPTEEGVSYRVENGLNEIVVVITDNLPCGRGQIEVKAFAAFYLTGANANGEVTGTFIELMIPSAVNPDVPGYGVYARPKLIFY